MNRENVIYAPWHKVISLRPDLKSGKFWCAPDTSRCLKDLVGAFAQFPQLPKMFNRKAIMETL